MKIVVIHPPFYPINYIFYNLLGKKVDLIVYLLGEYPLLHKAWTINSFINDECSFKLRKIGRGDERNMVTKVNPKTIYYLIKDRPDIVISIAFWIPSLYSSILKNILKFKFLILTNAIEKTEANRSIITTLLRKIICANTDAFISASDLTTKFLNNIAPKVKTYLSVQTIDISKWHNDILKLPNKSVLKQRLNLPNNKTILLSVGNFIELKNWEEVFSFIKENSKYFLLLIGQGYLLEKYKEYISANNLQHNIRLVPTKEKKELQEYYKASDIFVFTSLKDTFGFVVPEALASSLPVVCSEFAGASTLINNGYNGYIFNPVNNLQDEIKFIDDDLQAFTENAYCSIKELTIENRVKEFVEIFNDILD